MEAAGFQPAAGVWQTKPGEEARGYQAQRLESGKHGFGREAAGVCPARKAHGYRASGRSLGNAAGSRGFQSPATAARDLPCKGVSDLILTFRVLWLNIIMT